MVHPVDTNGALTWVAPSCEHRSLALRFPWMPVACAEAMALIDDETLHGRAAVMAATHQAAIDYIAQAPVLVLAAAGTSDLALLHTREAVAERFRGFVRRRPQLRDMIRAFGIAPQLRRLRGDAIVRDDTRLLGSLSAIQPSRLAQIIPTSRDEQRAWLDSAHHWRRTAKRVTRNATEIVAWAAANRCDQHDKNLATELVDFAWHTRATFDRRWTFAEAQAACERWHDAYAAEMADLQYSAAENSEVADYGTLPAFHLADGYTFIALQTRKAIFDEGCAMHHCVATYVDRVFAQRCRLSAMNTNSN
ncbi:MAG: PcfJ domain-containing protein, partial [Pseudomonadota bacterium]